MLLITEIKPEYFWINQVQLADLPVSETLCEQSVYLDKTC
jgi:hypothetical protein